MSKGAYGSTSQHSNRHRQRKGWRRQWRFREGDGGGDGSRVAGAGAWWVDGWVVGGRSTVRGPGDSLRVRGWRVVAGGKGATPPVSRLEPLRAGEREFAYACYREISFGDSRGFENYLHYRDAHTCSSSTFLEEVNCEGVPDGCDTQYSAPCRLANRARVWIFSVYYVRLSLRHFADRLGV